MSQADFIKLAMETWICISFSVIWSEIVHFAPIVTLDSPLETGFDFWTTQDALESMQNEVPRPLEPRIDQSWESFRPCPWFRWSTLEIRKAYARIGGGCPEFIVCIPPTLQPGATFYHLSLGDPTSREAEHCLV